MKVDGSKIKEHRRDISIERVAVAADLTARRIQQIEATEGGCHLNLNVAKAIAKAIGVRLEDIWYIG